MTTTSERIRDRVLGSERRIGFWIVPLFLIVALLGATLAGGIVALYYAQQVRQLEATTANARDQVEQARQEITTTASEAQQTIDAQMQQAREELAQDPPVDSPHEVGIFAVSADHAHGEVRVGSAFVISSESQRTLLATTYRVVATEEEAVPSVRVFLEDGPVEARVHNYDRARDLATLELPVGPLPVPEWRPPDEPVERGDPLYLTGFAGPGAPSVLEGRVATVSSETIVPTMPVNAFLAGAPLLDAGGRVVAMASLAYAPFGPVSGDARYAVPVRGFCARAVECTGADTGTQELSDPGGVGEGGSAGTGGRPRAQPPTPPPEPPPETQTPAEQEPAAEDSQSPPPDQQQPSAGTDSSQPESSASGSSDSGDSSSAGSSDAGVSSPPSDSQDSGDPGPGSGSPNGSSSSDGAEGPSPGSGSGTGGDGSEPLPLPN